MLNTHFFLFADNSLQCSNITLPLHPRRGSISISRLLRHRHGTVDAMVVVVEAVVDQVGPVLVQSGRGEMTTTAAVATRGDNVGSDLRRCVVLALASNKYLSSPSDFPTNLLNPVPVNCKTICDHYFPQLCYLHPEVVLVYFLGHFC